GDARDHGGQHHPDRGDADGRVPADRGGDDRAEHPGYESRRGTPGGRCPRGGRGGGDVDVDGPADAAAGVRRGTGQRGCGGGAAGGGAPPVGAGAVAAGRPGLAPRRGTPGGRGPRAGRVAGEAVVTAALMTALVIGAGTDYAVFVIGRFQEARRRGMTVSGAAADSVGGIATVILASGLTVAAACMSMAFTEVGIFRTAGPPIAVGILVALAVALTLGPALLTVFGRSGRADARVDVRVGAGPARRAAAGRSR